MSGGRRLPSSPAHCLVAGDLLLLRRCLPLEIIVNIFQFHLPPNTACFRRQFLKEFAVLNALRAGHYQSDEAILRAINSRERVGVVKLLIDRGANVNTYDRHYQETALMQAAANGNYEIAELLLQHGARTDPTNAMRETALLLSISHAHYSTTLLLLQHGAFVNDVNDGHETPLIVACYGGNVRLVERLLHHNADISRADDGGLTALMVATKKGRQDIVRLLLQHGATDEDRNREGRTALMLTTTEFHHHSADIARMLLDSGSRVEAIDQYGQTALIMAAAAGDKHSAIVQTLLTEKANVNMADFQGQTALMRAVAAKSFKVASMLLACGAAANMATRWGETALTIALTKGLEDGVVNSHSSIAQCCRGDIISLLIDHGAIPYCRGKLTTSRLKR